MTKGLMYALSATSGTGLGTSTTKSLINNNLPMIMPAWAREIVNVNGTLMTSAAVTTVKPNLAVLTMESNDVDLDPTQLIVQPQQALLSGSTGEAYAASVETYDIHAPLQGGENILFYGTQQVAATVAPYLGATITVSNQREGRHQYAKTGTYTSIGTTASTFVAGTAYNIHGSEMITEAAGVIIHTTPVAALTNMGWFRLFSTDFLIGDSLQFTPPSAQSGLGTPYLAVADRPVARFPVEIPTRTTCTIADYFYADLVTTTAGGFLDGVLFYKAGRQ